ncbi:UNVERIFIED_CONTAM: hypothetical protein Sradi_2460100 [Sesamum radiatum]|uniref:Uncharacterized protein n=1 Tax=Sesamum radiatum TaxID=300843 RepID=A0AAW2SKY4_SESRA
MELPQETEDYIRESIDDSVGLPVSSGTLLHKLRAVEASHMQIRHQYLCLQSRLKEKDEIIERSRVVFICTPAEASMNAVALKKFVEENQKLAVECSNLLAACNKWERECSLYDHDREALMDFANEADERAKEAEMRNFDLEEEKKKLEEELNFYKFQSGRQLIAQNYSKLLSLKSLKVLLNTTQSVDLHEEQILLDALLTAMFGKDETTSTANSFLEAHSGVEECQKLLKMWTSSYFCPSLKPLTQKVIALAADAKNLEKDKDHLTINLRRAEEEGKRKSSPKLSSPVEKKIDFGNLDPQRQPLSPLQSNSPESRMHKK